VRNSPAGDAALHRVEQRDRAVEHAEVAAQPGDLAEAQGDEAVGEDAGVESRAGDMLLGGAVTLQDERTGAVREDRVVEQERRRALGQLVEAATFTAEQTAVGHAGGVRHEPGEPSLRPDVLVVADPLSGAVVEAGEDAAAAVVCGPVEPEREDPFLQVPPIGEPERVPLGRARWAGVALAKAGEAHH
jgi:hypothetical protein